MEDEREKLPECNPIKKCSFCGIELLTWRLHLYIGEEVPRLPHNFFPIFEPGDGPGRYKVKEICPECLGKRVEDDRKSDSKCGFGH